MKRLPYFTTHFIFFPPPRSFFRLESTINMTSFDIVIFGATGFTGQFVVEELAQVLASPGAPNLTWAVAGRNEGKLKKVGGADRLGHMPRLR